MTSFPFFAAEPTHDRGELGSSIGSKGRVSAIDAASGRTAPTQQARPRRCFPGSTSPSPWTFLTEAASAGHYEVFGPDHWTTAPNAAHH